MTDTAFHTIIYIIYLVEVGKSGPHPPSVSMHHQNETKSTFRTLAIHTCSSGMIEIPAQVARQN